MKKKLFSILTLLLCLCTGAWAEDEPTLAIGTTAQTTSTFLGTYSTEGITLSSTASYSSGAVQLGNTPSSYDQHYFEVLSSSAAIEKVSFLISGNGSNKSIQAPVFGWATTATSNTADTYRILDAVTVTTNSYAAAQWFEYNFSASDVKCLRIYRTTKYVSSTDPEYTGSSTALGSGQTIKIYGIKVWLKASATVAPTITTDLSETANVTVGVAQTFSIVATGASSYQWYKDEVAIEGATSASYSYTAEAAGTVNLKCVATNSVGSTTSTVCAVTATMPASAPTITTDLQEEYEVLKGSSIELSIVAEGASSYQWYTTELGAIEGATSASYTVQAGTKIGSFMTYYCAATNAAGTTYSKNAKVTTTGRTDCKLTNVKFSNTAYGAINDPAGEINGTVMVPYMAGTEAPTVEQSSIKVSDGATWAISNGTSIVVTAENGTTTATYDITTTEFTPLEVKADIATTTFDAVPSWISAPYGWDEEKGVKFAKKVDEASNMRVAKGNTRQYWFIGAAKTLTLTSGSAGARNIKVYRNGTQLETPTATAANGNTIDIALDEFAPCMIMIESNQTSGDGGFIKYAITAPTTSVPATITEAEYATFSSEYALDFSETGIKVYTATDNNTYVKLNEIATGKVPANTPVVLYKEGGASVNVPVIASADAVGDNDLRVSTGTDVANMYVLAKKDSGVGFYKWAGNGLSAGKVYLLGSSANAREFLGFSDGETTGISSMHNSQCTMHNEYFDLQGRKVAQPAKGLYIVNGKKVIIK